MFAPWYEGALITLEGGIGVGKSYLTTKTFPKYFEYNQCPYLPNVEDVPEELLSMYINDMPTYGAAFQIHRFEETRRLIEEGYMFLEHHPNGTVVVDRGLDGNACFAKVNHDLKNISDANYDFYQALMKNARMRLDPPDLAVYLDTFPEILYGRMRARGIATELNYMVPYLRALDDAHFDQALKTDRPLFVAYDCFPPPDLVTELIGAVLRAKSLDYEWPTVQYTAKADAKADFIELVPYTVPGTDLTIQRFLPRFEWDSHALIDAWKCPEVEHTICLDPVQLGVVFPRILAYYLMMRTNVVVIKLH